MAHDIGASLENAEELKKIHTVPQDPVQDTEDAVAKLASSTRVQPQNSEEAEASNVALALLKSTQFVSEGAIAVKGSSIPDPADSEAGHMQSMLAGHEYTGCGAGNGLAQTIESQEPVGARSAAGGTLPAKDGMLDPGIETYNTLNMIADNATSSIRMSDVEQFETVEEPLELKEMLRSTKDDEVTGMTAAIEATSAAALKQASLHEGSFRPHSPQLRARPTIAPSKLRGTYIVMEGRNAGHKMTAYDMEHAVQRLYLGRSGTPDQHELFSSAEMAAYVASEKAKVVGGGRVLSADEVNAMAERLYSVKRVDVKPERPRSVRVRHVRTENGTWVDQLLPALELTPQKQTTIMVAMYQRGNEDAAKREAKLKQKYLQPLGSFKKILFKIKVPKTTSSDSAPLYMTKDMERVTEPIKGTSVYPSDAWKLS